MRGLNITFVAAIAGLALAASACEDMPTQPDNQMGALAVGTSNGQDRVTLCHRSKDGEYVIITVADAAYDTHMMHGDRDAGLNDACPDTWISVLNLEVDRHENVDSNPLSYVVHVTLQPVDGGPEKTLEDCYYTGEICTYEVPAGSTIVLSSGSVVSDFFWDGETNPSSGTRIMDFDHDVFATWSSAS